ncbi:hypothetical protein TI06_23270, partial [Vibrio vulnificus]
TARGRVWEAGVGRGSAGPFKKGFGRAAELPRMAMSAVWRPCLVLSPRRNEVMNKNNALRGLLVLAGLSLSSLALAHGDVTPQAV